MRLRSLLVLGTAALLLVSGCAPEPDLKPTASPSASSSPSASPTPTPGPVLDPEAAFDVTCDDVAAELAALVGEPSTPVEPVLSVISSSSWLPGPAQHMFQRAGGIACSAGDDTRNWEVTIIPDAATVIEGVTERLGRWDELAECREERCSFELPDGDVLLSAAIEAPEIGTGDTVRIEESMRRLAAAAAASVHDVDEVDSDIVGAPCESFITPQEVSELVGEEAALFTDFGGWGVPAEVYENVNGSRICYYTSAEGNMETMRSHLMITTLPAGAWAFERLDGVAVDVAGADAARTSTGAADTKILDVLVGADWIRLKTYDNGAGAPDPLIMAEKVVRNLTAGYAAP